MRGTEFLTGQGLGNQFFCYVSSRCLAIDNGCEFGTAGQNRFANNIHSCKGSYFVDIDLGSQISHIDDYTIYHEAERRIRYPFSRHDRTYGCSVACADPFLIGEIPDHTLIYGNLQDERYFKSHKNEICQWLKIRLEYDNYQRVFSYFYK